MTDAKKETEDFNLGEIKVPLQYFPKYIEFDWKKKKPSFVKGEIYSFINEDGEREEGECVSYNKETGRVKLKNSVVNPGKQILNELKYSKIRVTYHGNSKKVFTPSNWNIFGEAVTKIAKKIEFYDLEGKKIRDPKTKKERNFAIGIMIIIISALWLSWIFYKNN